MVLGSTHPRSSLLLAIAPSSEIPELEHVTGLLIKAAAGEADADVSERMATRKLGWCQASVREANHLRPPVDSVTCNVVGKNSGMPARGRKTV